MEKVTLSIKEFEQQAPIHMIIKILYEGEWLIVDDYDCDGEWLVIKSDDKKYRISEPVNVLWSIDEGLVW